MKPLVADKPPRQHFHLRSLAARVAVVSGFTVFAVAAVVGIAALNLYSFAAGGVSREALRDEAVRQGVISFLLLMVSAWGSVTLADMLLLRRVRKLVEEVRRVTLGDTNDVQQIPGGMGELNELTDLFARMRDRMVEAATATDEKVRSRTADLEFNKGMAEFEQARTEALISSIGEAVIATDREGRIIFINQEVSRAMGWTQADLVGKRVAEAVALLDEKEEPVPPQENPALIALASGQKQVLAGFPKPHWTGRKDGSRYPVHLTVTPVVSNGNIIGAIEVVRDITDEAELDRRKTEFISIASHQLRSPLAATKWLSDMLRNGDLGELQPKQKEIADKLFEANERMVVLVNELLNVSRLDAGTSKPTPEQVPAVPFVEALIDEARPLLAAKKQQVAFEKADVPPLFVDKMLVREALMNVLSNAIKYSPDGATVTVTLSPAPGAAGMAQVAVRDQGIGIPKSDQSQLFKKFFRAANAQKSAIQGTGLGLYFVKSVIEMSGGKTWYDSEENKGTVFYVTLPVAGKGANA